MAENPSTFKELLAAHTDAPYDPEHREFIQHIASAL
jgi:hypothetical protein